MSNAVWSYRQMLRGTPASFFVMAAGVPLGVLLAWAELRLPALVVSEVTGGQTFLHAALAASALLVLTFLAVGLRDFCKTILEAQESRYRFYLTSCLEEKSMAMFYQTYEKKQTRDQRKRAEEASYMMNGKVPLCQVPNLTTGADPQCPVLCPVRHDPLAHQSTAVGAADACGTGQPAVRPGL